MKLLQKYQDSPIFYVYAYLDTRKPKNSIYYKNYCFEYPPFYIGKGKDTRFLDHLNKSNLNFSSYKVNTINAVKRETGKNPIIIKIAENLLNEDACALEKELINFFGRKCNHSGILTNIDEGNPNPILFGKANGFYGEKHSKETKEKIIKKYLEWYNKLSPEEKKKRIDKIKIALKLNWQSKSQEEIKDIMDKRKSIWMSKMLIKNPNFIIESENKKLQIENKKLKKLKKREEYKNKFKLKNLTDEERIIWYKTNRSGSKNPNYGNGEKISGNKNGRAKCYKIIIGKWTFIVHGKIKLFGRSFKNFFKSNDPIRSPKSFQKIYNLSIEVITEENPIFYEDWIVFENLTSFERLKNEVFKKCKDRGH